MGTTSIDPVRCMLVNTFTGKSMTCLFNPAQVTEKVTVNWNRLAPFGQGHHILHFQSTNNRQLTSIEFYCDALALPLESGAAQIEAFRAFLLGLTKPVDALMSPPHVLLIWPKVLTIEAILSDVEFTHRQWASTGELLAYTATCNFEEIATEKPMEVQL